MPNMTFSVTDEFKQRMDEHKHIRWSSAVRAMIERQLDEFEEFESLVQKSRITQKDIDDISRKVRKAAAKHFRELLNETSH